MLARGLGKAMHAGRMARDRLGDDPNWGKGARGGLGGRGVKGREGLGKLVLREGWGDGMRGGFREKDESAEEERQGDGSESGT